ncbi:MAG: PEP/pyruvate-binding domain-containing protein, partial [Actinomycetota bacterium]|nr:PEP/pyruvate-binding domain-containing protein [Actinomycetota bacterium]
MTPLSAAGDPGRFGGKAAHLAAAREAGLPVPDGWALGWGEVEALILQETCGLEVEAAVRAAVSGRGPVAVRSSAVGEDSQDASFAGTHLTVLGLVGGDAVIDAVRKVHASAVDPGALAYREKLAIGGAIRMGVVVQEMVDADVAGVLFTRDPLTGADGLVIEASWGLGEAVVSGLVTPDHVRADPDGRVLERVIGEKDIAIRLTRHGATEKTAVPPDLAVLPCLGDDKVQALCRLVRACDDAYADTAHDIEFAFTGES